MCDLLYFQEEIINPNEAWQYTPGLFVTKSKTVSMLKTGGGTFCVNIMHTRMLTVTIHLKKFDWGKRKRGTAGKK